MGKQKERHRFCSCCIGNLHNQSLRFCFLKYIYIYIYIYPRKPPSFKTTKFSGSVPARGPARAGLDSLAFKCSLCFVKKKKRGKKKKEKNDFPVHRPLAGSCTKFNLYFL